MIDNRLQHGVFDKVFIVGAGASYPAGIPVGNVIFREMLLCAENDSEMRLLVGPVINRLKKIYPRFNVLGDGYCPSFEEYLNVCYDFSKGSNVSGCSLPVGVKGLRGAMDDEALHILYWYLHFKMKPNGINSAADYLPQFIFSELGESDAIISLNYDWLFEWYSFLKEQGVTIEEINNNKTIVPQPIKKGYGPSSQTKLKVFKPHGSVNWMTGNRNESRTVTTSDGLVLQCVIGDEIFTNIFGEDDRRVYLFFPIMKNEVFESTNDIAAIVPPQGFKGHFGSKLVFQNLIDKNPKKEEEYKLLAEFFGLEQSSTIQAIHKAEKEVWLIGTTLKSDPYLLNQLKLRKMSHEDLKIKIIDPKRENIDELADFLGEVKWYKGGGMKEFSDELQVGFSKNGMWQSLSENSFQTIFNRK